MTDTTNNPDEPDGNGSVSTQGVGGEGAGAPDATGAPGGNGSGGSVPRRPSPGPAAPGNPAEDAPGVPAPGAPGEVPVAAVPDRPPASGSPGGSASPERDGAPSGVSSEPASAPRSGESAVPTPAPGPVPNPGPAAAAPPPWRRMPDQDTATARTDAGPPPAESGTSLLDDVPTAFVEPAGTPDSGTDGGAQSLSSGSAPSSDRPGWSSMRTRARAPRRAVLQLKRFDPWSVLKLALVLAGVLFLVWMVAVGLLYGVLDGMGVWDRLNGTYSDLVSGDGASGGQALISAWRVFGYAALFGVVNSVLAAVALTVSAFLYNVSADLVGGIELTMSEPD